MKGFVTTHKQNVLDLKKNKLEVEKERPEPEQAYLGSEERQKREGREHLGPGFILYIFYIVFYSVVMSYY